MATSTLSQTNLELMQFWYIHQLPIDIFSVFLRSFLPLTALEFSSFVDSECRLVCSGILHSITQNRNIMQTIIAVGGTSQFC